MLQMDLPRNDRHPHQHMLLPDKKHTLLVRMNKPKPSEPSSSLSGKTETDAADAR